MKKFTVFLVMTMMLISFGPLGTASATYIETVDVYQYSVGGTINWNHTYDFSETPPFDFISLSIVADDVDLDEEDAVFINGIFLGNLTDTGVYTNWGYVPGPGSSDPSNITTSLFIIDGSLLDWTMPVVVNVASAWGVEIETSTLTVQGAAVPEPATMLLLGLGLIGLAGLRRKFRKS